MLLYFRAIDCTKDLRSMSNIRFCFSLPDLAKTLFSAKGFSTIKCGQAQWTFLKQKTCPHGVKLQIVSVLKLSSVQESEFHHQFVSLPPLPLSWPRAVGESYGPSVLSLLILSTHHFLLFLTGNKGEKRERRGEGEKTK